RPRRRASRLGAGGGRPHRLRPAPPRLGGRARARRRPPPLPQQGNDHPRPPLRPGGPMRKLLIATALALFLAAPAAAQAAGGIPDTTFGGTGFASIDASFPGARESGDAMVVDAQDRILVGGGVLAKTPEEPNGGWVLARFRSDGTRDPTFGE